MPLELVARETRPTGGGGADFYLLFSPPSRVQCGRTVVGVEWSEAEYVE